MEKETEQLPDQGTGTDVQDTNTGQHETDTPHKTESDKPDEFDSQTTLTKIRKLNAEAAALRKRAKEAEEKAATVTERDSEIAALKAQNLRLRVGATLGLPQQLLSRLQGETEEEIMADAETLLALFEKKTPPSERTRIQLKTGAEPANDDGEERDLSKLGARMGPPPHRRGI